MNKNKLLVIFLGVIFLQQTYAQNFGVIAKASTAGIGVDIGYRISPKILLKAGYDTFKFDFNTTLESEIDLNLESSLSAGTVGLLLDYAIARKVYISAGVLINNFQTTLTGTPVSDYLFGEVVIPKESLGSISWDLAPKTSIAPYIGIGIGRLLGSSKTINTSLEFGVIYQGGVAVDIASNGIFSANSASAFQQNTYLEGSLKSFELYPVLKLNIGLNFLSRTSDNRENKNQ